MNRLFLKNVIKDLLCVGVVALVVYVTFTSVLLHGIVPTESMEPTLPVGCRFIADRYAYFNREPEFGDVVVFKSNEDTLFVKRVFGTPGDHIEIKDGHVYLNGNSEPISEDFIKEPMIESEVGTFDVPENCYFMLGDNRNNSFDSRKWENPYVKLEDIRGKVYFLYYPKLSPVF